MLFTCSVISFETLWVAAQLSAVSCHFHTSCSRIFPVQGLNPHLFLGRQQIRHWATWEAHLCMLEYQVLWGSHLDTPQSSFLFCLGFHLRHRQPVIFLFCPHNIWHHMCTAILKWKNQKAHFFFPRLLGNFYNTEFLSLNFLLKLKIR